MQRVCLKRQIRLSRRRLSTTLLSASATLLLSSCAVQPVAVQKEVPQELVKPELPIWRKWSETYTDWLKRVTEDGTAAPQEKTP